MLPILHGCLNLVFAHLCACRAQAEQAAMSTFSDITGKPNDSTQGSQPGSAQAPGSRPGLVSQLGQGLLQLVLAHGMLPSEQSCIWLDFVLDLLFA